MHPSEDALNAYADGSLPANEAAGIERHLAACVSCRHVVDDLREIVQAASDLGVREPPVRAWPRIERAIRLEQEHAGADVGPGARGNGVASGIESRPGITGQEAGTSSHGSGSPGSRPGASRSRVRAVAPWLAAAAALVVATLVGLRYRPIQQVPVPTARSASSSSSAQASASEAAQSVESELRQAEAHYENAIKGLEQIANTERNELDPRTAATLQKNLAVIDQAISESRAAIRSQPASEPAQQSLIENFKTKIALLQDTVALINEMRKGNEAGAARIVSGLKDKGN